MKMYPLFTRRRRGLVLPVGLVGRPSAASTNAPPAPPMLMLTVPLNVPDSVRLPLKLSVRCEPLATARAAALRAAAAVEGRPPSFPAAAIVAALTAHKDVIDVAQCGCSVLRNLAGLPYGRSAIISAVALPTSKPQ